MIFFIVIIYLFDNVLKYFRECCQKLKQLFTVSFRNFQERVCQVSIGEIPLEFLPNVSVQFYNKRVYRVLKTEELNLSRKIYSSNKKIVPR